MNKLIIRNEQEKDYHIVEEVTREAFWNLYVPGCNEHYLVHMLRQSADFIPELAFVAELDNKVIGSIFFTRSYVIDEKGLHHDTITFGPVSLLPQMHKLGIGTALIKHAVEAATKHDHKAILIYGYPGYYKRFGFRHAKEFGISSPEGQYPMAHLALELYEGALSGISGKAYESDAYLVEELAVQKYDNLFKPKQKKVMPSQKVFEETLNSFL